MRCAMMRPIVSCGPPAANGMTMVTGRDGKLCAAAEPAMPSAASAPTATANIVFLIVVVLPLSCGILAVINTGGQGAIRPPLPDFGDFFGKLVQPVAGAVAADDVVVAQPVEIAAVDVGRVHDNVHILLDRHRLIVAHQRTLDEVVALAVAIKPRLLRAAVLAHE